jgi:hypothetical protein
MPSATAADAFERREDHIRYVAEADAAPGRTDAIFDAFQRYERATQAERHGEPLRILCDLRAARDLAHTDRRPIYERHHEFDRRRVVVLGNSRVQQIVVDFLIAATGHANARYFVDEQEALGWLRRRDGT